MSDVPPKMSRLDRILNESRDALTEHLKAMPEESEVAESVWKPWGQEFRRKWVSRLFRLLGHARVMTIG
jgi:hypothetical protein